ncbi:MAG: MBL fold metallo-hydrolase [Candidatus Kapabacteria bacterium]|jgi:L-ascorbate metabolism protein UlaG (beta-lactamase superfamily)|nr:MBL fold metallo-hydrolase [Candidatus Kapabacteria bacterium]
MVPNFAPVPKRLSTSDHARTAATAILDALLPTKRRPRRSTHLRASHPHSHSFIQPRNTFEVHDFTASHPHKNSLSSISFNISPQALSLTRLGHSSVLLNCFGTIILFDPVLADRVGIELLGKTIGIDRYEPPILTFDDIPQPDFIVLSHAHFDHTDVPTLRHFAGKYPDAITVVCAKNTQDVIADLAWKNVVELDWEESLTFGNTTILALKVIHNGWRCPWERDRANGHTETGRSFNAYLVESQGKKIVFGGDTAWTEDFSALGNMGVDIAIMPIGAYQGYETLHCTPEQALDMARMMNAETFVPIHFGAFQQSNEEPDEPLQRLLQSISAYSPALALTSLGQSLTMF